MSLLKSVSRLASAVAVTTLLAAVPALAVAQDSESAVWVPRDVTFVYQAFTSFFSCEGLRTRIRTMLQQLGAQDLNVRPFGCVRAVGPTHFPGVRVTMRVLVPADSPDAAKAKDPGSPVQAHWQEVVLMPANASRNEQGNCELIEQFKETFLPLFGTRNVQYQSNCIPHQITLGTHLSAEVLKPAHEEANGSSN